MKRGGGNSPWVSASIGCDMSKSGICDCYIQVRSKRNVNLTIVSIKTLSLSLKKRALTVIIDKAYPWWQVCWSSGRGRKGQPGLPGEWRDYVPQSPYIVPVGSSWKEKVKLIADLWISRDCYLLGVVKSTPCYRAIVLYRSPKLSEPSAMFMHTADSECLPLSPTSPATVNLLLDLTCTIADITGHRKTVWIESSMSMVLSPTPRALNLDYLRPIIPQEPTTGQETTSGIQPRPLPSHTSGTPAPGAMQQSSCPQRVVLIVNRVY